MSYFLYGSNGVYNTLPSFNCFSPSLFYPSYESFSTFRPIGQTQSLSNFQTTYPQNPWYGSEVKISDTREGSSENLELNSQGKDLKSTSQKNQKRSRNVQKQLESAKKNCESNLVNQFLSYFSSYNNSQTMIIRALQKMNLQNIVEKKDYEQATVFFCKQISIVNSRRERKYVNKSFLQNYFTVQKLQKYMPDILERVDKFQMITKPEFCQLFRRCCFNFFRTVSVSSVTSSAKLNEISRPEHVKRRRLIVQTISKK